MIKKIVVVGTMIFMMFSLNGYAGGIDSKLLSAHDFYMLEDQGGMFSKEPIIFYEDGTGVYNGVSFTYQLQGEIMELTSLYAQDETITWSELTEERDYFSFVIYDEHKNAVKRDRVYFE